MHDEYFNTEVDMDVLYKELVKFTEFLAENFAEADEVDKDMISAKSDAACELIDFLEQYYDCTVE